MSEFDNLLDSGPPYASIVRYTHSLEQVDAIKKATPSFATGLDEYLRHTNDKTLCCQFDVQVNDSRTHMYYFQADERFEPTPEAFDIISAKLRQYNLIPDDPTPNVALECLSLVVATLAHNVHTETLASTPPVGWMIKCSPEVTAAVFPYLMGLKIAEPKARFIGGSFRLYKDAATMVPDDIFVIEDANAS